MVHSSIYGELNFFLKSGLVGCFQDITSKFHILTNWLSSFFGPWFWNVEQIIFNIYLFSLNHIYSHPSSNAISERAEGTQAFEDVILGTRFSALSEFFEHFCSIIYLILRQLFILTENYLIKVNDLALCPWPTRFIRYST